MSLPRRACAAAFLVVAAGMPTVYPSVPLASAESRRDAGTTYIAAPWCPSHRALLAKVGAPGHGFWGADAGTVSTVLVDDTPMQADAFRVMPQGLAVCVAREGPAVVMAFGLDADGRLLEFDSSEAQALP